MIEVIVAMDIIDDRCVRLTQGDYDQKTVYAGSPLDMAKEFESAGVRRLHLVDLDGARTRKPVHLHVLERIASQTSLNIDFGGGLASSADLESAYDAGATIVVVGSVAVEQPELFCNWLQEYGGDGILLAADVRGESVAINGWQQTTSLRIVDQLRRYIPYGLTQYLCTDIAKDGILDGPSAELYSGLNRVFPQLRLIASGGVSSIEDIQALERVGCHGVIVGKALYEGKIDMPSLQPFFETQC
ncbi:MAG: 1-(5-phosphoribosyl)-5-[(5-phosphoribosylamino)methylideneamino]imidazole-4-carboxamide isomerase [Bacteroidetes bacterium]|nr:1-(5-phosphoribosyl)-5-[(5-phosphoribosylamino)methylideneamino]imidazole-4-carboxamide isomerase [Bacteroidota bacterium]